MSIEAMKLAIEVFKSATPKYTRQRKDQKTLGGALDYWRLEQHQKMKAIKALEEALAKQEQGEPVAWRAPNWGHSADEYVYRDFDDPVIGIDGKPSPNNEPLYTTPQQRKPLTDEEIDEIWQTHLHRDSRVRAIEAAHGIKE